MSQAAIIACEKLNRQCRMAGRTTFVYDGASYDLMIPNSGYVEHV
jgi:hypothetical protein